MDLLWLIALPIIAQVSLGLSVLAAFWSSSRDDEWQSEKRGLPPEHLSPSEQEFLDAVKFLARIRDLR
jgi:hypothetical protein